MVVRQRGSDVLAAATVLPIPDYGNAGSLGRLLFSDFLFPFEAISVLLLVAVVAGVLLARPFRRGARSSAPDGDEGGTT
jgi:NADH-quinone oxidoreductase subunit J